MTLPIFKDDNKNLMLMQTAWSLNLNPVVSQPFNSGLLLKNVSVRTGNNVINHKLGKELQGWIVTRMQNSFVQLYDLQNTNQMSDKTLILNSSANGTIDLLVF